jgi:hypothetical protein
MEVLFSPAKTHPDFETYYTNSVTSYNFIPEMS